MRENVPSKFGAIIRRVDGVYFTLADHLGYDPVQWFSYDGGWATEHMATSGGFTVVFDGVDVEDSDE